jgi:hypothetical protein
MLLKLVPDRVLNNGTDTNEVQLLNMLLKLVPEEVLNNGTDANE